METILRAENISRSFKINDNTTVDALKDINLDVEKNKLVVLRGRSGSGKTTLMNIIGCPEGIKAVQEAHPDVEIFLAAVDEKLNEHGYIVPGLGDAGDRIFGTK